MHTRILVDGSDVVRLCLVVVADVVEEQAVVAQDHRG